MSDSRTRVLYQYELWDGVWADVPLTESGEQLIVDAYNQSPDPFLNWDVDLQRSHNAVMAARDWVWDNLPRSHPINDVGGVGSKYRLIITDYICISEVIRSFRNPGVVSVDVLTDNKED